MRCCGPDSPLAISRSRKPSLDFKIALIILHADPARGGAERYTIDLATTLGQRGHHVTVLAATARNLPANLKTRRLPCRAMTRLGQYDRFLNAVDEHLARSSYNIVHAMLPVRTCHVYHPHAGVAAEALAAATPHPPSWLTPVVHAWPTRKRRFASVERDLLSSPRPPLVLCLSDYVRRQIHTHYPAIADHRLVRLFNAVDLQHFRHQPRDDEATRLRQRLSIASDDVVALMVAQDFARKGLREAIEALASVHDPRLTLVVVGRDKVKPYRDRARQLLVADRVRFAGPAADPRAYYRAADFLLLPTRHDPCSLVVLEALAMGLPVISTAQNGACEIMCDGREGLVLQDPSDIPRLADAMRSMLDPQLRSRMRDACLTLRPQLSQDQHVRRLIEAYEQATSPPPPQQRPSITR